MFIESSDIYDLIYSFKDYEKEANQIHELIQKESPGCKTILDVGCGTSEHHKYLSQEYEMNGIDLNAAFIETARQKNPAGNYRVANMIDFDLGETYDVILCLFSSIGYVKTKENLAATLACFRRHLSPNGKVIVEPWITPENWYPGKLHMLTYEADGLRICRMNQSATEGNCSRIHFHYLLGTDAEGVRHFEEVHELGLFTVEEMKAAFSTAGFSVEHDPEGLTGRGLYVGN